MALEEWHKNKREEQRKKQQVERQVNLKEQRQANNSLDVQKNTYDYVLPQKMMALPAKKASLEHINSNIKLRNEHLNEKTPMPEERRKLKLKKVIPHS